MKKLMILAAFAVWSVSGWAVSMNFSGNFRGETTYYDKPDLGGGTLKSSKAYLAARALLNPNLVIDDHFQLKSQWSLLASPMFTPGNSALGNGQGGFIFGDVQSVAFNLNRVWLEWTSDFGVFRLGRMPVAWGYGLVWDAGNNVWDDFQTTLDRIEYRLHLGYLSGALAFSKPRKLSVLGDANDSTLYTVFIQYENPELDVEGGILYENQWRAPGQAAEFFGTAASLTGFSNPYRLPGNPYPLSLKTPYPRNNHVLDIYAKKTAGYFTFGGEFTWLTGKAFDYNGDGQDDSLNAFGLLLNGSFEYHKFKVFLDFLLASGDNNLQGNHLNGFTLLHRNRRPGLILGRELLGKAAGNNVGMGSCVVYGNTDNFSGCVYLRPGFRYEWSPSWASGVEVIVARKATVQAGEEANLGVEVDLGTDYAVYQNFDLGVNVGYLFSGAGLGVTNPSNVIALRATAALRF